MDSREAVVRPANTGALLPLRVRLACRRTRVPVARELWCEEVLAIECSLDPPDVRLVKTRALRTAGVVLEGTDHVGQVTAARGDDPTVYPLAVGVR